MKIRLNENDIRKLVMESVRKYLKEQTIDESFWEGHFDVAYYLNDKCFNGEYYDEDNEISMAENYLNQLNVPSGFDFSLYDTGGVSGMGSDDVEGETTCENIDELMPLYNQLKNMRNDSVMYQYYLVLSDFIKPRSIEDLKSDYGEYVFDQQEQSISDWQRRDDASIARAEANRGN